MNQNYLNLIRLYKNSNYNQNLKFYSPIEGFSKGNLDKDLYDQFLNYVPRKLNENDEFNILRANLFAVIDLQLYLDTHPDDQKAKELFDKYLNKYIEVKKSIENKWGPLVLTSKENMGQGWKWLKKWMPGMSAV